MTNTELSILRNLVEQFDAYRNGWLGEGVWRDRIGLPADLDAAHAALAAPLPQPVAKVTRFRSGDFPPTYTKIKELDGINSLPLGETLLYTAPIAAAPLPQPPAQYSIIGFIDKKYGGKLYDSPIGNARQPVYVQISGTESDLTARPALTERSPEATAPTVVQETPDPMLSIPGVKKIGAHYYCICNLPEKILEFVTEIWSESEQRWRPLTSNERIQLDVDMMSPAPRAPAA